MLEIWSSSEKQLELQKNIPIAHVSHDLFNDREAYFADGFEFDEFLSKEEITLFYDFNHTINEITELTPQVLPDISEFIKTEEWKIVNRKAKETLKKLRS